MGKVFNRICSVPGCKYRKKNDSTVHFHRYPLANSGTVKVMNEFGTIEKMDRRKAWEMKIKLERPICKTMVVCSKHFVPEDYVTRGYSKIAPRLKLIAVPSINLPRKSPVLKKFRNKEQKSKLAKKDPHETSAISDTPITASDSLIKLENLNDPEKTCVIALLSFKSESTELEDDKSSLSICDNNFPVANDNYTSFTSTIQTERQLNSLTGIMSFKLLNILTNLMKKFYPEKKSDMLTIKERIILVFMKIKLSLTFGIISFIFKINSATSQLIFDECFEKLSNIFKNTTTWPSINEILNNIPSEFKYLLE